MIFPLHEATKHTVARIRTDAHVLDFENMPAPFKRYEGIETRPLPRPAEAEAPALEALAADPARLAWPPAPVHLGSLARILFLAAGITKVRHYPGGEIGFRAAPCTGALYHIEVYVASKDLLHFQPADFSLEVLRRGDHRGALVEAAGGAGLEEAEAIVVLTSVWWRNAWKYRARAYRHAYWDGGCIVANLLAAAASAGVPAIVVTAFDDGSVERLLDLDRRKEGAIALVGLGRTAAPPPPPPLEPLGLRVLPVSREEIVYDEIVEAHTLSALAGGAAAADLRRRAADLTLEPAEAGPDAAGAVPLRPRPAAGWPKESLDSVVRRRGSTRRFAPTSIPFEDLSTILEMAMRPTQIDLSASGGFCEAYVIAHAVDGLEPGAYALRGRHPCRAADRAALAPLLRGDLRRQAGGLALGQDLAADAAANIYFLADLEAVEERLGPRGYRAAALEAGIRGGRVYLAAYALRLGATGLTFFDDDVVRFLAEGCAALDPARHGVMFLAAVGRPHRAARRRG